MFENNRNAILLAFILLMLAGVALLESSALVVLILLGLLFLVRQFDNNQLATDTESDYDYDYSYNYNRENDEWEYENQVNREVQSEPVYRHALQAVSNAGLDPDEVQVLAVDIGVMAYKGSDDPQIYRTWSLPDDTDYIQPFVQLRLPSKANGRIKFELLDGAGNLIYSREEDYKLERGRNLVTPTTRLPIHDERFMQENWQMRVTADDVLLAIHSFEFSESTNEDIRRHISDDGEINTELRAVMAESRLPKMSLDELLDYQEQQEQEEQRRSSSS